MLKKVIFFILIFSLSGCAINHHHRSINDRKKGFMLLENTSQSMNKKYKKTRYAKKVERRHKSGKRMN